ncbi:MAG: hypothetical protein AAGC88_15925 [Bacteroidota bacterium]
MTGLPQTYLLKGDISGIQEFIFSVPSRGAAGALRARSFYVQLISDLAVDMIFQDIGYNQATEDNSKVFYNGGGNFFLILHSDEYSEERLAAWQQKIDQQLRHEELYVSLTAVPIGNIFFDAWEEVNKMSNKNKLKPFQLSFDAFDANFNRSEVADQRVQVLAAISNRSTGNKSTSPADLPTIFGTKPDSYLDGIGEEQKRGLPKWTAQLIQDYQDVVDQMMESETTDEDRVAPKPGNIVEFGYLAEMARQRTGSAMLGILKLDVDNLHIAFEQGKSEASLKSLSRKLTDFFSQRLIAMRQMDAGDSFGQEVGFNESIYTVFSGGDDCFFVGSWDAILMFASVVQSSFSQFVKELKINQKDQSLTISAGLSLVPTHFPVVRFAEMAEDQLHLAKTKMTTSSTRKNAIGFMNQVFSWKEFENLIFLANLMRKMIDSGQLSRSLVQKIQQTTRAYKTSSSTDQGVVFPKVWRLTYATRDMSAQSRSTLEEKILHNLCSSMLAVHEGGQARDQPTRYGIISRIAELLTRKKKSSIKSEISQ